MTRPLLLDRDKAAAIAASILEQRPELARQLARSARNGEQTWRIRASLDDDGMVTLTAMVGSRVGIGLTIVPRAQVERGEGSVQ